MAKKQPHYCGECCWHHAELTDGELMCIRRPDDFSLFCDTPACKAFCTEEQRDEHVDTLEELAQTIECLEANKFSQAARFAAEYIKLFSQV